MGSFVVCWARGSIGPACRGDELPLRVQVPTYDIAAIPNMDALHTLYWGMLELWG